MSFSLSSLPAAAALLRLCSSRAGGALLRRCWALRSQKWQPTHVDGTGVTSIYEINNDHSFSEYFRPSSMRASWASWIQRRRRDAAAIGAVACRAGLDC
eukprot:2802600-Pleurochrysis_carterae.AAC.1